MTVYAVYEGFGGEAFCFTCLFDTEEKAKAYCKEAENDALEDGYEDFYTYIKVMEVL